MKKTLFCLIALVALTATTAFAEKKTTTLYVEKMECGNCQAKIEKTLSFEKGVKDLTCDLSKREVTVVYDDAKTDVATLQASLVKYLNYESQPVGAEKKECHEGTTKHEGCKAAKSEGCSSTAKADDNRSCCGKKK